MSVGFHENCFVYFHIFYYHAKFHFPCFFYFIRINSTFVLKTMQDLDWFMLELEEEKKFTIVKIL